MIIEINEKLASRLNKVAKQINYEPHIVIEQVLLVYVEQAEKELNSNSVIDTNSTLSQIKKP